MSTSTFTLPTILSNLNLDIMESPPSPLDFQQVNDLLVPNSNKSITKDVIEALEIARDSPEAASHGPIRDLLELALGSIWDRILANDRYVMTRDEFAIFNFFQSRFRNSAIAIAARKRYWDNLSVSLPS
ncbi:hypothetical protein E0Z10_g8532 [Xylaria hypoxylon]|uniref:Uncharacterized protein n=1 Tax=Xylaria hypoxylon TaxID=37992 RepID=A0A4Z0YM22_9PEZI|nr:hypothetical protein E0Z10_g8532 [Xylaria hypoxylon]